MATTTRAKLALTGADMVRGFKNLEILKAIIERGQHAKIQVGGKSITVDAQTASVLTTVYAILNNESQAKFCGMLTHDASTFRRTVDFSWKQVG